MGSRFVHSIRTDLKFYRVYRLREIQKKFHVEYYCMIKSKQKPKDEVYSKHRIVDFNRIDITRLANFWYPVFECIRQDTKTYNFTEADFINLHLDDIEFTYNHLLDLTLRPEHLQVALEAIKRFMRVRVALGRVEDFQLGIEANVDKVNILRPKQDMEGIEALQPFTVIREPFGVVYLNEAKEKKLMRIIDLQSFSEGTLKTVRAQLRQQLEKDDKARVADKLKPEMRELISSAMSKIEERYEFRSYHRRFEKYVKGVRNQSRFTATPQ